MAGGYRRLPIDLMRVIRIRCLCAGGEEEADAVGNDIRGEGLGVPH